MSEAGTCIFCRVSRKEVPANIRYEDDRVMAFDDINPQSPVHILVVPRKHMPDLEAVTDADLEILGHLYQVASKLAVQSGFAGQGYRLVLNNGRGAGQIVPHLHLHVLSGRRFGWPPG